MSMNEHTHKSKSIAEQMRALAFGSKVSFKGTGLATFAACLGELVNSTKRRAIKRNHRLSVRDREKTHLSFNMLSTKTHAKTF